MASKEGCTMKKKRQPLMFYGKHIRELREKEETNYI